MIFFMKDIGWSSCRLRLPERKDSDYRGGSLIFPEGGRSSEKPKSVPLSEISARKANPKGVGAGTFIYSIKERLNNPRRGISSTATVASSPQIYGCGDY